MVSGSLLELHDLSLAMFIAVQLLFQQLKANGHGKRQRFKSEPSKSLLIISKGVVAVRRWCWLPTTIKILNIGTYMSEQTV